MDEPLLALDGALGSFSVAVLRGGTVYEGSIEGRRALEAGLGLVESVLEDAGVTLHQLGGLAVVTGPGGFTGLRIAISYAKSLAFGARLPLVGVSSFDVLDAAAAGATEQLPRLTVVQGRPGVACMQRTDAGGIRTACGPIEATVARLVDPGDRIGLVGATEDVRAAVGERASHVLLLSAGSDTPAAVLAKLALGRIPAASAHAVAPDYGELPAATLKR